LAVIRILAPRRRTIPNERGSLRPFLRDSVREVKAKFPIAHLGMKVGVSGCFLIRTGAGEILISFGWRAFSSFLDAA
jgi:hypothetical protein